MKGPESIGEIIRRYRFGRVVGREVAALIREHWTDIVGENLALHCRPGRIRRKTLEVTVGGSAWANEIAAQDARIKRALERVVGGGVVERIRLVNRERGESPEREFPRDMNGVIHTHPHPENYRAGVAIEDGSRPAESGGELERALRKPTKPSSSGKQYKRNT